ncbi:MAG TPA: ThuA domain-containing protein [Kofleriaceae bacterium]|nr:ThuA domain-containing protein [Kofleriaceae bacterium]
MTRAFALLACAAAACGSDGRDRPADVLAFSRTAGFRHDSAIIAATTTLPDELAARGLTIRFTEDAAAFTDANLARFHAVFFLYTTLDVLDADQQAAFERFAGAGGGFIGIHSAADTEYDWPFYQQLVGATFASHPAIQPATIDIVDRTHPATAALPDGRWSAEDEWYNFVQSPRGDGITVLLTVDETTYSGGTMGADHPIAWSHERLGGRAFYSALGHDGTRWSEPAFVAHVLGGIEWVLEGAP